MSTASSVKPSTAAAAPEKNKKKTAPRPGPFAGAEVASPSTAGPTDFSAVPVPISNPRYEFKTRVNRKVTVTDTSASEPESGRSAPATDYLSHRGRESLTVRQGPVTYTEPIEYRSYGCYRHGARQIHTHSVGYSSDGDLVLMRREVSVVSDRDDPLRSVRRRGVGVDSATCLNPQARAVSPQLDADADPSRWNDRRLSRLKKYPGVRCPKNRKTRNRLLNDHFSGTAASRALYEAAAYDSDPDGLRRPAERIFEPLPARVAANLVYGSEGAQVAEMRRLGLLPDPSVKASPAARATPHIDSAAFRFAQLNARLKGELQHAVSATDFMPGFIEDLENQFTDLIAEAGNNGRRSIAVPCKDGYGRLITHGVAAFYKLQSASETAADGVTRVTVVSLPAKKVFPLPQQRLLTYLRGDRSPIPPCSPAVPADSPVVASTSVSPDVSAVQPPPLASTKATTSSTRRIRVRGRQPTWRQVGGRSVTPDFGVVDPSSESDVGADSDDESESDAALRSGRRTLRFRRRVVAVASLQQQRNSGSGSGRVRSGAAPMSRLVLPSSIMDA